MKKTILMSIILSLCFTFNCYAEVATEYNYDGLTEPLQAAATVENETDLQLESASAILIDANTGTVLFEKNAHEKTAPASITKIMTLLLVMEAMDAGKINLDTEITADEYACSMGGSQIWLEPGEKMTVDELLKAAVVASANDASVALGTAVAGNNSAFVAKMNEKAKELGLKNTHFENATGLDADNHYSSAYDVAMMSKELIKHSLIKNYTSVWMDTLRDGECELVNTNKLVKFYSGCTGLKTGTTSKAGSCLSATAERDSLSLISVIMNAPNSQTRFNEARTLLDYGFASFENVNLKADNEKLTPITVKDGFNKTANIIAKNEASVLIEKGKSDKITQETEIYENITAPVEKGQKVGEVKILLDGKQISNIDIIAAEQVPKLTLFNSFKRLFYCLLKS